MTINRRLLNWGVFFITTGAVVLAITGGLVTADGLADLFGLWPVLVIALGVGVLLRATRLRMTGGIVLAIVPGLVLGGLIGAASIAELPDWHDLRIACAATRPATLETRVGTFSGPATVDLDLAGGELTVTTRPGPGWELDVAAVPGAAPAIDADADGLEVTSTGRHGIDCRSDTWRLALPTGRRLDLATEIAAGEGTLDLAGATLGTAGFVVRAAEASVDLSNATVEDLSLRVEAGAADLTLPATGDYAADVDAGAGAVRICAPDGLALRVRTDGALASITTPGLVRSGAAWESPDYATAAHHADVTVSVNVGSVDVNPEGGCK